VLNELKMAPLETAEQSAMLRLWGLFHLPDTWKLDLPSFLKFMRAWFCWADRHHLDASRIGELELELVVQNVENQWIKSCTGVSRLEVEVVRDYFALRDTDGSGTIESDELVTLFEDLGVVHDPLDVTRILAESDRDRSGSLDVEEFMGLLLEHARLAYARAFTAVADGERTAPRERLGLVISSLGITSFKVLAKLRSLEDLLPQAFDFDELWSVMHEVRKIVSAEYQAAAGFSPEELARIRATFASFDADRSGRIEIHELIRVFESMDLLPRTRPEQDRLEVLLSRMGTRGHGLDIRQFICLSRAWSNTRRNEEMRCHRRQ